MENIMVDITADTMENITGSIMGNMGKKNSVKWCAYVMEEYGNEEGSSHIKILFSIPRWD